VGWGGVGEFHCNIESSDQVLSNSVEGLSPRPIRDLLSGNGFHGPGTPPPPPDMAVSRINIMGPGLSLRPVRHTAGQDGSLARDCMMWTWWQWQGILTID
jgi:hypothetical protein